MELRTYRNYDPKTRSHYNYDTSRSYHQGYNRGWRYREYGRVGRYCPYRRVRKLPQPVDAAQEPDLSGVSRFAGRRNLSLPGGATESLASWGHSSSRTPSKAPLSAWDIAVKEVLRSQEATFKARAALKSIKFKTLTTESEALAYLEVPDKILLSVLFSKATNLRSQKEFVDLNKELEEKRNAASVAVEILKLYFPDQWNSEWGV